jgi:hypothetical protein
MFIPSLMSQASQEQQQKWLPQCFSLQIIGTYAQVLPIQLVAAMTILAIEQTTLGKEHPYSGARSPLCHRCTLPSCVPC